MGRTGQADMAMKVIVELQAKPGRRDALSSLLEYVPHGE
jgi:hypothetical protein